MRFVRVSTALVQWQIWATWVSPLLCAKLPLNAMILLPLSIRPLITPNSPLGCFRHKDLPTTIVAPCQNCFGRCYNIILCHAMISPHNKIPCQVHPSRFQGATSCHHSCHSSRINAMFTVAYLTHPASPSFSVLLVHWLFSINMSLLLPCCRVQPYFATRLVAAMNGFHPVMYL